MCTSTGRKCDGYKDIPDRRTRESRQDENIISLAHSKATKTREAQPSPTVPSSALMHLLDASKVDLTRSERWLFDFFRKYTSSQCASYFYDEFWQRFVHQISEGQPAVRHAAIAMSSRHCQFEQLKAGQSLQAQDSYLTLLQQCNKAASYLRQLLMRQQADRTHKESILATCVILTTLALFQEDNRAAYCHLNSGCTLLEGWQKVNFGNSSAGPILIQAFAQLQLHWSTCSGLKTLMEDEHPCLPSLVTEVHHISKPIDYIWRGSHFFLVLTWLISRTHPQGFSMGPENSFIASGEAAVLSKLRLWRSELKGSIMVYGDLISESDRDTLTLLELWSEILCIKAVLSERPKVHADGQPNRAALDGRSYLLEMRYDGLTQHFHRAILLAKALLTSRSSRSTLSVFDVKAAILLPLFFCGFRCRDWHLRRQALFILRQSNCQESDWGSKVAIILERLIEIESEGVVAGKMVPEFARVDSIYVNMPPKGPNIHWRYRRPRILGHEDSGDDNGLWKSELLSY